MFIFIPILMINLYKAINSLNELKLIVKFSTKNYLQMACSHLQVESESRRDFLDYMSTGRLVYLHRPRRQRYRVYLLESRLHDLFGAAESCLQCSATTTGPARCRRTKGCCCSGTPHRPVSRRKPQFSPRILTN